MQVIRSLTETVMSTIKSCISHCTLSNQLKCAFRADSLSHACIQALATFSLLIVEESYVCINNASTAPESIALCRDTLHIVSSSRTHIKVINLEITLASSQRNTYQTAPMECVGDDKARPRPVLFFFQKESITAFR